MEHLEPVIRFFKYLPSVLWVSLVSLAQWFIPKSWYAKDVSKDIVLITGAGSGLGRQIAIEYAKLNSSLVLWDINEEGLKETRKLVNQEHAKLIQTTDESKLTSGSAEKFCLTYVVDVSDRDKVYAGARQVQGDLDALPRDSDDQQARYISVLVNNAGIYHGLMFKDLKDQQIERIFKINILAHFWTVRAFLPAMIKHERGHIVEIASMGGISGLYKQVDYCSTKFATIGFEESLSIELMTMGLGDKIYTTAVCPFFFQSNLFTGFDSKAAPIMSARWVAREAVMGMRCNHARVLLPQSAHILNLLRPITPRRGMYIWTKIMNLSEGIRDVKGAAAS